MDPNSREAREVEARLRARYEEIWRDVRRELEKHRGQQYQDLLQGPGDPEDVGTAQLLVDLNLSEIDRDVAELHAVQNAIARLKRGRYGICQVCGREIAPERLRAVPYATLCVEDQERAERGRIETPSL